MAADQKAIRGIVYGLHDPNTSPTVGVWTVSWTGVADVRSACTFLPSLSTVSSDGLVANGTRAYNCTAGGPGWITIYDIDSSIYPLSQLFVGMPDPASPLQSSLAPDTLFYPTYIQRIKEKSWAFYRTMDLTVTNDNPQQDWIDRRLPSHLMASG